MIAQTKNTRSSLYTNATTAGAKTRIVPKQNSYTGYRAFLPESSPSLGHSLYQYLNVKKLANPIPDPHKLKLISLSRLRTGSCGMMKGKR